MMNKTEIFRKIGGIIAELNEQYQYLSENIENMNELELELFIANSNFLTDHAEILKKLNANDKVISINSRSAEPTLISELEDGGGIENITSGNSVQEEAQFDFENKPLEELYSRKFSEEEQEIINRKLANSVEVQEQGEIPVEEEIESSASFLISAEPAIEGEIENISHTEFNTEKSIDINTTPTINEVISLKRSAVSASPTLNQQPINDLKTGINLNDKLLFIKDLFNGYSLAYSEAIEILNRFDSFEVAENFLKINYAAKNDWVRSPSTVEKFYEILRRRYAK